MTQSISRLLERIFFIALKKPASIFLLLCSDPVKESNCIQALCALLSGKSGSFKTLFVKRSLPLKRHPSKGGLLDCEYAIQSFIFCPKRREQSGFGQIPPGGLYTDPWMVSLWQGLPPDCIGTYSFSQSMTRKVSSFLSGNGHGTLMGASTNRSADLRFLIQISQDK